MIRRAGFLLLVIASMLALATERSIAAADEIEKEPDVEYSNPQDQHLKLNLARPSKIDGLAPGVVCIHGGGWRGGDRGRWQATIEQLARRGFVAVTVQYRFAPDHPFPAVLEDVQAAVRWAEGECRAAQGRHPADRCARRLGRRPSDAVPGRRRRRRAVDSRSGRSARQRYRRPIVPGAVRRQHLWAQRSDASAQPGRRSFAQRFSGGDVEHARQQYVLASPFYWVTPDAAPTLIIHGTKDNIVPYEQATLMHDRLKAAGVEVELLTLEGAGHGFEAPMPRRPTPPCTTGSKSI